MKKLLITGVSGLLGSNLAYYFRDKYEVLGLYNSHSVTISGTCTEKCDISDVNSIEKVISEFNPSVIIHCASLTNIDQCETNKELTEKINFLSTKNLIDCILDKNIKAVYISTDAVYDGVKGAFLEDDNISPLNYYGRSKYEGEREVEKKENFLIFRTNIFGWNIQDKKSIGEWVLGELTAKRAINCFTDAYFSSIYTMELARVIDLSIRSDLSGVYNCGSSDSCSKYEYAKKIAEYFGLDKNLIHPMSIDDFNFKAKRGKNLTLNANRLQKALDYKLPRIDQSIEAFYKDYRCGLSEEIKHSYSVSSQKIDFIPYGRQWIDENDIYAVAGVLRSDRITQGPKVDDFERSLSDFCGAKHAVAVNSGTSALHIACLAAGIKKGDEVITSPISFVASANCALYCGARPIFADIDAKTYNISAEEIEKKITKRTRAIIPVHFAGQSCAMESIQEVVRSAEKKFGEKIHVIEDACHALGSLYKSTKVGSCAYADMTVMSFHPVKHITTGEGGVVFTKDLSLFKKLKLLRSHGITSDPEEFLNDDIAFQSCAPQERNPWYYEQIALGYNYRITDMQCALGLSQIKKLEKFRKQRRILVDIYNDHFRDHELIQTPYERERYSSNFHLYVLLFDFKSMALDRAHLMLKLHARGIQTQVHYIPVHLQSFYQKNFGYRWGDYPVAEQYYSKCLSIPLFSTMTENDAERVYDEIKHLLNRG